MLCNGESVYTTRCGLDIVWVRCLVLIHTAQPKVRALYPYHLVYTLVCSHSAHYLLHLCPDHYRYKTGCNVLYSYGLYNLYISRADLTTWSRCVTTEHTLYRLTTGHTTIEPIIYTTWLLT